MIAIEQNRAFVYSDELLPAAIDVILETGQASVSMLQRRLYLGYARAARIVDEMEKRGIVGPFEGAKPRRILITRAQWTQLQNGECLHTQSGDFENIVRENFELRTKLAEAEAEMGRLEKEAKESLRMSTAEKLTVAKAELLTIDLMDGHDFENWCAGALRDSEFQNVSVTPGSGDQGVDVLAEKDGIRYAIQCKRYNSDLGNTPVQEVFTGARFYNCHAGAVITNRNFTTGAKSAAAATGVLLWGRSWILEYLYRKHGVMLEVDPNA